MGLRVWLLFMICVYYSVNGLGQSTYMHHNTRANHIMDRLDIKYDISNSIHFSFQNFQRKDVFQQALNLAGSPDLKIEDYGDIQYLLDDNAEFAPLLNADESNIFKRRYLDSTRVFYYYENQGSSINEGIELSRKTKKPFLKHFYKEPAYFFYLNNDDFSLVINPAINIKFGSENDTENIIYQNTRGIIIRGLIDQKIYFHTSIYENQRRFNNFTERTISAYESIPGQGSFKDYQSSIIDQINGYDFLNAKGYVGIPISKSIAIEFGHGNHFIGHGHRSLLLSDYGHNYFYLKFSTNVWKFQYQNLFTELSALSSRANPGDVLLPKKYMAAHFLNFKVSPNFELGFFEAVIFSRENHFELQYLNPIILYRSVEQFLDSPDNVLLGINGKLNLWNRVSIYGQFMLDELKVDEFFSSSGWWGNKYGVQLGMKYIDVLNVDHLDFQFEFNSVRPYTYSHRTVISSNESYSLSSYSHFNQPLAHPLGANFNEWIGRIIYQPSRKFNFDIRFIYTQFGMDAEGENFGGNILIPSNSRESDFDNSIAQGNRNNIFNISFIGSYEFFHNYFIDFHSTIRSESLSSDLGGLDTQYFGAGIRINLDNQMLDY